MAVKMFGKDRAAKLVFKKFRVGKLVRKLLTQKNIDIDLGRFLLDIYEHCSDAVQPTSANYHYFKLRSIINSDESTMVYYSRDVNFSDIIMAITPGITIMLIAVVVIIVSVIANAHTRYPELILGMCGVFAIATAHLVMASTWLIYTLIRDPEKQAYDCCGNV